MPRGAHNAAKTHCPQGHALSGDNLKVRIKKGRSGNPVRSRECRACITDQNKKAWAEGKNRKSRDAYLRQTYGLSQQQYEAMLAEQDGLCAVCRRASNQHLDVDHDHRCCPGKNSCGRCVRGLICRRCNLMLGYANEDPDVLVALAAYLITGEMEPSHL